MVLLGMTTCLCLNQGCTEIVEGIMSAKHWVTPSGLALPDAERTLLRLCVDLADIVASFEAIGWNCTIATKVPFPTRAFAIQAQAFGIAVVGATWQCALWPDLGLISADDLAAIWTAETYIAGAFPIETQTVACTIIWALHQAVIDRLFLTQCACPPKMAIALARCMDRDEGASAMGVALYSIWASSTVGIPAVGAHETLHAVALALGIAFAMRATVDLADFS